MGQKLVELVGLSWRPLAWGFVGLWHFVWIFLFEEGKFGDLLNDVADSLNDLMLLFLENAIAGGYIRLIFLVVMLDHLFIFYYFQQLIINGIKNRQNK